MLSKYSVCNKATQHTDKFPWEKLDDCTSKVS